jgi:hypothetical protein
MCEYVYKVVPFWTRDELLGELPTVTWSLTPPVFTTLFTTHYLLHTIYYTSRHHRGYFSTLCRRVAHSDLILDPTCVCVCAWESVCMRVFVCVLFRWCSKDSFLPALATRNPKPATRNPQPRGSSQSKREIPDAPRGVLDIFTTLTTTLFTTPRGSSQSKWGDPSCATRRT